MRAFSLITKTSRSDGVSGVGAQNIEREKNAGKPWPPITAGAIKSLSQMNIEAGRRAKLR
jgi:hypothetical protein